MLAAVLQVDDEVMTKQLIKHGDEVQGDEPDIVQQQAQQAGELQQLQAADLN